MINASQAHQDVPFPSPIIITHSTVRDVPNPEYVMAYAYPEICRVRRFSKTEIQEAWKVRDVLIVCYC